MKIEANSCRGRLNSHQAISGFRAQERGVHVENETRNVSARTLNRFSRQWYFMMSRETRVKKKETEEERERKRNLYIYILYIQNYIVDTEW